MIEDTTNHCSVTDSVEVFENIIKPDAVLGNDLILKCSDSTITIDGSASSSGVRFKFEWSTPDGKIRGSNSGSQVIADKAGKYFLILTDLSNSCMDTAQINVINDANKPSVAIDPADTLTARICSSRSMPKHLLQLVEILAINGRQIWVSLSIEPTSQIPTSYYQENTLLSLQINPTGVLQNRVFP